MKPLLAAVTAAAALLLAAAGPPGAESCTGCHVQGGGIGVLQGRPAPEIAQQMQAFRAGAGTLMPRIARGFSPAEIDALATWFAAR